MTVLIGIDPGVSGAVSFFEDDRPIVVHDIPVMQRGKTGNKQQINAAALAELLRGYTEPDGSGCHAYLEHVMGAPRKTGGGSVMGAASAFNFGHSFGVIEGVLGALKLPYSLVMPGVWKKRAGLLNTEKDAARTLAIRTWPSLAHFLARKKDIGRADALLIAHYGSAMMERAAEIERKDPLGAQGGGYG